MKSVRPKDVSSPEDPPSKPGGRNAPADFRGETPSNATHAATTDPDAKLYRKGPGMEAKLAYMGHALMENRSGLFVDARVTRADGHAERNAALAMIEPLADRPRPIRWVRTAATTRRTRQRTALDERAPACGAEPVALAWPLGDRPPHDAPPRLRGEPAGPQAIEEGFGWIKQIAGLSRPKLGRRPKVDWAFTFAAAAYNLVRLPKLFGEATR